MKQFSLLMIAAVFVLLLTAGCKGPGMTQKEVNRRHLNTVDVNTKLIQDDIDKILLLDQPSRQTEYIVR